MQYVTMERGLRGSKSVALVPKSGTVKIVKQSKEILFPYEDFVKLFNWDKPGFPPCGLLNSGNSCFANVVLQCLSYTRPLVAYVLEQGHRRECRGNDWCFLCEFQTHVERAVGSHHPFSPLNILSRLPNIGGNLGYGKQEDAHEFMRFAIDTMQSVCLNEYGGEKALHPSTQETTLVQHIFGGHLQSQVVCAKCNIMSNQYENMMDLTVEIHGDATSLEECLDQFTVREKLHGDNLYKCDGCNDYVTAWKRLTVWQAPNILTIALKRFQGGRFGKLNKPVTFPETLDLSPYMSERVDGNDVYKLYAVVVHIDMLNASFSGHYICYTKDFCGNWYRIDDCKVTRVDLDVVLSQGAYMLLYSRVCARQSCLKYVEALKEEQQTYQMQEEEEEEEEPCARRTTECCLNTEELVNDICSCGSFSKAKVSTREHEFSDNIARNMEMVDCTCGEPGAPFEPAIHNSGVEINYYKAENTDSSRESSLLPIQNCFDGGGGLSSDNFLNEMDPVVSRCELKEMAIGKCSFPSSSTIKDTNSSGKDDFLPQNGARLENVLNPNSACSISSSPSCTFERDLLKSATTP